jgi:hypothetical protein
MSIQDENNRLIVRGRVLYNALIKTVLFCWNHGCPIANPHEDIRFLARNSRRVADLLTAYFDAAPPPSGDRSDVGDDFSLPGDAVHLAPIFSSISALHRAVLSSDRACAHRIAGKSPYETIQNLTLFFEEQVNCREK